MIFIGKIKMPFDRKKWMYFNSNNNRVRYVLGKKGSKPLICFGINPSTAEPDKLDNTLKAVEKLSHTNGYDSWIMLNIYPQRATNPKNIHLRINNTIHRENLAYIEQVISGAEADIWAAWGTLIESRPFLLKCLSDIFSLTKEYQCRWFKIGKQSKSGHPHHPLYLKTSLQAERFNIDDYIYNLAQRKI